MNIKESVRDATMEDEDALVHLNGFVHEIHLGGDPRYFKPTDPDDVADWFRTILARRTARVWIAEEQGVPVGYAVAAIHERPENPFCWARRWVELDQICVHPDYRRRGIAGALVRRAFQWAAKKSVQKVELNSWSFNPDAQEAFRRLGFRPMMVHFGQTVPHADEE